MICNCAYILTSRRPTTDNRSDINWISSNDCQQWHIFYTSQIPILPFVNDGHKDGQKNWSAQNQKTGLWICINIDKTIIWLRQLHVSLICKKKYSHSNWKGEKLQSVDFVPLGMVREDEIAGCPLDTWNPFPDFAATFE